jgi:hypothetical protein
MRRVIWSLRSVERLEAVPDSEDGLDVLIGERAEFLSQPPHMHIECASLDIRAIAPDAHEQRVARNDFPGMLPWTGHPGMPIAAGNPSSNARLDTPAGHRRLSKA